MMPTCRDMTELSTDYLERALGWRARVAVRWHLAFCGLCRAYYDQLAKTTRLLRFRPLAGPDPAVESLILAARPTDKGTMP
jgi:predicted anti-sigma-YlaC factor YlaD